MKTPLFISCFSYQKKQKHEHLSFDVAIIQKIPLLVKRKFYPQGGLAEIEGFEPSKQAPITLKNKIK